MKYAITVKNLNVYAKNVFNKKSHKILKKVSFNLRSGKVCVFIGHNGAGKTTTVKSILGLRPFDSGNINIFDKSNKNPLSKLNVSYIPEKGSIEKISAKDFLRDIAKFNNLTKKQCDKSVRKLLKQFDLGTSWLKRKMNKLSSGQNKIVNIIQAFLGAPKLIIADEPTDNLDPENRDMFWDFVAQYHKEHPEVTFFIITHNLDEVEKYTNYIVIIDHGKIKHVGPYNRSAGLRLKYRKMRDKWRLK